MNCCLLFIDLNMNFKTVFRCLSEKYRKFPSSHFPRNVCLSNGDILMSKRKFHRNKLSGQSWKVSESTTFDCVSHRLYSPPAHENSIMRDQPNNVINVQTLEFDDMLFEQQVSHDDLLNALKKCRSVEEQMKALKETLSLSKEDVKKRIYFCKKIESLLSPFFSDIKIQMFGSSVNGFGFKGCDIDMSFETSVKPKDKASYLERPDVPLVSEVITGKVTPFEISQLPAKEQLLFIHSVLLEFYKYTDEPIIFINAHVPLVRFYHDKYNLKCDLSCGNKVAYANTKLLYLFAKLDKRVIPLMMTIRYWAKHVELIGKGLMFNTYTISLLVIYFLQSRSPPVLPSAQYILSVSDKLEVDDMNDESFLSICENIPASENTQTLDELLREFFFFYLYFDFTRVICPLIAKSIPRDQFFSNLVDKKFRMNTICVQDPMLVSHNVAELVDFKHCKKLCTEIMVACKIFQDSTYLNPTFERWGLMTLLDKPEKYTLRDVTSQKLVSFTVPLISENFDGRKYAKEKYSYSAETVLHILQHVLLFECRLLEHKDILKILIKQDEFIEKQRKLAEALILSKNEMMDMLDKSKVKHSKSQRNSSHESEFSETSALKEFKEFNKENKLILCTYCTAKKNTWLGRNFVDIKSFSGNDSLLAQERFISVNAAKQNDQNNFESKPKPFSFLYECYISPKDSESLIINFRPIQKVFFNPVLGLFLKDYLPELVKQINGS